MANLLKQKIRSFTEYFLEELNRGGLSTSTLSPVYFAHCGINLHDTIPTLRKNCAKYLAEILFHIDATIAEDRGA